jgi:hypothetical protein
VRLTYQEMVVKNVLVIPGADGPPDVKAPGTETALAASRLAAPAVGWAGGPTANRTSRSASAGARRARWRSSGAAAHAWEATLAPAQTLADRPGTLLNRHSAALTIE